MESRSSIEKGRRVVEGTKRVVTAEEGTHRLNHAGVRSTRYKNEGPIFLPSREHVDTKVSASVPLARESLAGNPRKRGVGIGVSHPRPAAIFDLFGRDVDEDSRDGGESGEIDVDGRWRKGVAAGRFPRAEGKVGWRGQERGQQRRKSWAKEETAFPPLRSSTELPNIADNSWYLGESCASPSFLSSRSPLFAGLRGKAFKKI